mmetsp:Transcript_6548/g.18338  ORF Transcript_6548/g.18338 Transcript_6548/m.18338 type:complete len:252 (-) Transcript_6548:1504-2259(-)
MCLGCWWNHHLCLIFPSPTRQFCKLKWICCQPRHPQALPPVFHQHLPLTCHHLGQQAFHHLSQLLAPHKHQAAALVSQIIQQLHPQQALLVSLQHCPQQPQLLHQLQDHPVTLLNLPHHSQPLHQRLPHLVYLQVVQPRALHPIPQPLPQMHRAQLPLWILTIHKVSLPWYQQGWTDGCCMKATKIKWALPIPVAMYREVPATQCQTFQLPDIWKEMSTFPLSLQKSFSTPTTMGQMIPPESKLPLTQWRI